ncbi:MAG: hypothetical protein ACR2M3_07890 [Thermomicrobiales bacterium]
MQTIRVYPDLPIAGMEGEREAASIDLHYDFDGYTITVEHVFVWRDKETGEEFIPGDLSVLIDEYVRGFAAFIDRQCMEHRPIIRDVSFRAPMPSWNQSAD